MTKLKSLSASRNRYTTKLLQLVPHLTQRPTLLGKASDASKLNGNITAPFSALLCRLETARSAPHLLDEGGGLPRLWVAIETLHMLSNGQTSAERRGVFCLRGPAEAEDACCQPEQCCFISSRTQICFKAHTEVQTRIQLLGYFHDFHDTGNTNSETK